MLAMMAGFFAFTANGQTFSIDSVSENAVSFYPFESVDVFFTSEDNEWPSDFKYHYIIDMDGDGEYDSDDHLLASGSDTTFEATLPNEPGNYDLYVVAGNDGQVGESINQNYGFTTSANGTASFGFPYDMDQAADREVFIDQSDYDDGDNYTLFVELEAPNVTSDNPIVVEYSVNGEAYVTISDVEGETEFSDFTDSTFVFMLPEEALTADVTIRVSQQNAATLAADEEDWVLADITIQSTDGTFVEYDVSASYNITILNPSISLGDDSLSVYVGEGIGVAYESFGYTSGATFYLYTGDILDPEDRMVFGSSTSLEDSITGSWGYADTDVDLYITGYYGNFDTPEWDLDADTLTILGSSDTDYGVHFNESGVRSATSPSFDLSGEEYATLELSLNSGINNFTSANALVVAYNTGSGWVTIDTLTGLFNSNYEYEITSAMQTASTMFRVRQANTTNSANVNAWYLNNFDIKLHEVQNTVSVPNTSSYPMFYSVAVEDILMVNDDDDTVSITSAYPGDDIMVHATAAGFDLDADSVNLAVIIDGMYLLEGAEVNIDGDSILIAGSLPADISYETALDVHVKLYTGSSPVIGLNVNVFDDYDAEEEDSEISFMGGEYSKGTKSVSFENSGDRWLTTPAINIATTSGLSLEFTLKRESSARSPEGTEVVLEFSTDGSTFSTIETYSINAAGTSGTTYTVENDVWTSSVVSSATHFRFRQLSNNGVDLDGWTLSNVVFENGTTIQSYNHLNYNASNLDITEPEITLETFDDTEEYYPGEDLVAEFNIEGEFPSGTKFKLLVDNEVPLVLGEFTTAGTHTVKVPALVAAVYSNIKVIADHEDVESNAVSLTINAVQITDISITSSESTTDGDYEFIYPGNEITVSYSTIGQIGTDVLAYLEVYDGNEDEYVILEDSVTVGTDITTTLPIGLDYTENGPEDGNPGPDFRLTLKDMSGSLTFTSFSQNWFTNETNSNVYFPIADRVANQGSNYFYNNSGTAGERSATSILFDFTGGGEVDFDINLVSTTWYDEDQEIYLQYSTDNGDSWSELETGIIKNDLADIFPDRITIPDEAKTDSVRLRFIYNQDESRFYANNYVQFTGFDIYHYESNPIAEEEFDLEDVSDLNLEYLSLSMATLEDTDFNFGEEFTVQYNADGPFGEVDFAVVMEETVSGDYMVLGESDQKGAVTVTVNAPEVPFGNSSPTYQIAVYPFEKVSDTDTYRGAAQTENLTEEDDFIMVSGSDQTDPTFTFDQSGDRHLVTRAIDLANYEFATLNFTSAVNGSVSTISTLPVLEASTDGETFTVIAVTGGTYEEEGLIYPGMSYNVEIPDEFLMDEVWFRWRQPLNGGLNNHTWTVHSVSVSKGESNVFNTDAYNDFGTPQTVSLNTPDLSDFLWEKADSLDAVYNGEDFEFTWGIDSTDIDETTFPEGTMFVFSLNDVTDPNTGEELILASGSSYGSYTGSIPYYVENDNYNLNITAYVMYTNEDDEEEEYFFFEEVQLPSTSLDVLNRAFRTVYEGDDLATLYAGSTVQFSIKSENGEVTSDLNDLYANLIAEYDGEDWLIASQQGLETITVELPPFMEGMTKFTVELSEDGALGEIGDILEDESVSDLENSSDNFISGTVDEYDEVYFASNPGRRLITTRDFEAGELEGALLFEFDVTFDKSPEELTDDQYVHFEYSIDGGATYTTLETYPDADEPKETVNDWFGYELTDEMRSNNVRFRWRQEESKGGFSLQNLRFSFAESLPFDYISDDVTITSQALLATSLSATEACLNDEITIGYEMRGKLGAEAEVMVHYSADGGAWTDIDGYAFNITEGSGTVTVELPSDVVSEGGSNKDLRFKLSAKDNTNEDVEVSIDGSVAEGSIEVVALIGASVLPDGDTELKACDLGGEVIVDLNNLQENFMYEFSDVATGNSLASFVYDGEMDEEVNLGAITTEMEVEVKVTSMSSGGSECNSMVQSRTHMIEILENYELYINEELVVDGDNDSIVSCEGASNSLELEVYRSNGDGPTTVEWFRDDLNNPVATEDVLEWSDFDESGEYFARVTDGDCSYTTEMYKVIVEDVAEQPEVTVTGDLTFCEGEGEVTLTAPAGYTFYQWAEDGDDIDGADEATLVVDEAGSYSVTVSNFSSCTSEYSEEVEVKANQKVEFTMKSQTTGNFLNGGETISACDETTITFYDSDASSTLALVALSSFDGVLKVYRDGALYDVITSNSVNIDQSGEYYVEWNADEFGNGACSFTSPTFTVAITESVDVKPTITAGGPIAFCEGGSVTLTAPTGYAHYQWKRGSTVLAASGETYEATTDGSYTVAVSNVPFTNGFSCGSDASNPVTVQVFEELDVKLTDGKYTTYTNLEEVNLCSDDDPMLSFSGVSGTYAVTWYLDGTAIAGTSTSSTSIEVTSSGTYHAEISQGVGGALDSDNVCVSVSDMVTINLYDKLDQPSIEVPTETDFCEGEVNLTLTATAGAPFYIWKEGGWPIFDEPTTSNTLKVNAAGTYTVTTVMAEDACESDASNSIVIETQDLANADRNVYTESASCDGTVQLRIDNTSTDLSYQLIDMESGENLGNPVVGTGGKAFVTVSGLTEEVNVLIEASYTDGSGCSSVSLSSRGKATPNAVILELVGTSIEATIYSAEGYSSYSVAWYRNGVKLNNATGTSINVTDAATYSIEVTYDDGCVITSNSVDLGAGSPAGGSTAAPGGRIIANTYPNPSSKVVNLDVPGENFGTYEVFVMTLSGQVLISGEFDKDVADHVEQIDIDKLDRGIYNLQVVKGKQVENIRIVKQ